MKINDSSNKHESLYHNTLGLLGISESDTNTLPFDPTFTRLANVWYRVTDNWIWQAARFVWRFDDSNNTDLPIADADLVDGQEDYEIPSAARAIERVEVKDSSGNFEMLGAIDQTEIYQALSEFQENDSMPRFYWMEGRSIHLKPNPKASEVTTSSGLRIHFARDINEFATGDTTKEPGFDNHFHPIISYGVALDWGTPLRGYTEETRGGWQSAIEMYKNDLQDFYATHHTDFKHGIRPRPIGKRL